MQCLNSRYVTFLNTGHIYNYRIHVEVSISPSPATFVFWWIKFFANAVIVGIYPLCNQLYRTKISMINFLPMRAGNKIGEDFLLAKISMYTVVLLIHSSSSVIPIVYCRFLLINHIYNSESGIYVLSLILYTVSGVTISVMLVLKLWLKVSKIVLTCKR